MESAAAAISDGQRGSAGECQRLMRPSAGFEFHAGDLAPRGGIIDKYGVDGSCSRSHPGTPSMILATQAAAEYAALAMRRAASMVGGQLSRAREFASDNFTATVLALLGVLFLLVLMTGSKHRRR
jgi:hypothetical protein